MTKDLMKQGTSEIERNMESDSIEDSMAVW